MPITADVSGAPLVYASWGRRAAAVTIDGIVLGFAALVLASLFGLVVSGVSTSWMAGVFGMYFAYFVFLAISQLVYAPVMLARSGDGNGQTLGKQALGIRVRDVNGGPVTGGQAFLREVVIRQIVIGTFGWIVLAPILDALWPLWERDWRALHDLAASTIVTRDQI